MKQNLVVLLADLFNLFEIHPAKCVCYPGMETQGKYNLFRYRLCVTKYFIRYMYIHINTQLFLFFIKFI